MEYLPGGNLYDLVTQEQLSHIPAALLLSLSFDISQGVKHIHNLFDNGRIGIVHGDLKPENILLTEDLRCKIGDFGTAAHRSDEATLGEYKTFRREFTRVYTAPERLCNCSMKPTCQCDTYSFAMLIYFMLTRNHPVAKYQSEQEFTECVKKGERPEIEGIQEHYKSNDREILNTLTEVMHDCWQQDEASRPEMKAVSDILFKEYVRLKPGKTSAAVCSVLQVCPIVKWTTPLMGSDRHGSDMWVSLPQVDEIEIEDAEDEDSSGVIALDDEDMSELSSESWEVVSSKNSIPIQFGGKQHFYDFIILN